MLTQKELKKILNYNPKTGIFIWLKSLSNRVSIGSEAGCKYNNGYYHIAINRKIYLSHRLAWLYVFGYFSENNIDHINRNSEDNRIENLREVTQQCNMRNTGNWKNNMSGVKGVSWNSKNKIWYATITINRRNKVVGRFDSFDEAAAHRLAAEQCLGWDGCDSSSPAYKRIKAFVRLRGAE